MKRFVHSAPAAIASQARMYPIIASAILALGGGSARADFVTTTGTGTGGATVQPSGPRSGTNGTNFFNLEGDNNGTNASYGVLDFNTTSFLSFGVTAVNSLTLNLTEANSSFTHAGSVEVYLASDSSATILAGAGNYTVPGYVSGLMPEGIGSNPLLLNSTAAAFGTLTDLGAIVFNATGSGGSGTIDTLTLASLSSSVSALLANDLNTNGTVRFVLTPNSTDTAATWAGVTNSTVATRPTLTLTYTGSVITYVTLLWTGTSGTWDTAASTWQTTSSTFTNWSNPSGSITTASFNTATPLSVDAGGVTARALTFLTGSNGMVLNGPGAVTLLQGNISVATGSSVTIAAQISGSVGINLTGGGFLTLTNINNNFTGPVTITQGTLKVNDTGMASLGNATNPIYLSGGSLVLAAAQPVITRNLLVTGANTLDTGTNGDMSFQAYITNGGSGTLTRMGTGILSFDLSDSNPPGFFNSGTLIIAQGTVRLTNADSGFTALGSGTAVVNGGATLSIADINSGGGLNVRNAPNMTLNAGGSLTATGGITTLSSNTIKISTAAGSPVVIGSGIVGDTFVINSALRDSATTGSSAVIHVVGGGILQMASGAVSAQSKPSSPAFSGSWDVSLDASGILEFGPINFGGLGEVLNSPGYHAPAVNSTSNNYSGATDPITVNSGTVAFGADAVNPNNTTSTLTIVSFRSPLILSGGNIASISYEYSDVFPNAGPGSSTPVTANLGTDITMAAGKTSMVLLYDPVAGAAVGGRSLNIMTDPNAASGGVAVSTNLTWGANSTLIVDATGVSEGFGALSFTRASGTVSVGTGARLQINPNAVVNLGGTQDALNDGTHQVSVINNGTLHVTGGNKAVGAVSGSGTLLVDPATTLTSDGVNMLTGTWTINGTQILRSSASGGAYTAFTAHHSAAALSGTSEAANVTFGAGAHLDLMNNALIVEATTGTRASLLAQIAGEVTLGTITSSTAATNPMYGVVVVDNDSLGATTFGGVAVDANSIIVTQALLGDANLDGVVNPTDLLIYAHNFNNTGSYSVASGDLNNDGVVNPTDLLIYAHNFNNNIGGGAPSLATGDRLVTTLGGGGAGATATPEPGSLAVLGLAAIGLRTRRKRRS